MNLKYYFYLFILCLSISCNTSRINVVGSYKLVYSNLLLRPFFNFSSNHFNLNADYTFESKTCSIMTGTWEVKKDSLFLYCVNNRFRNDSLNNIDSLKNKIKCRTTPIIYIIKGKKLVDLDYQLINLYSLSYLKK